MAPRTRRNIFRVLLGVLVLGGLVPFLGKRVSELPVYVTAAERMLRGERIHVAEDPKPFTYPPFFALPFVPLALAPDGLQRPLWYFVNVAALAWLIRLIDARVRRTADERRTALFWVLTLLLSARHLSSVFENQSHDLLVFLAVGLALAAWQDGRHRRAGFWIGAGAAMKATPFLFLPYLLWKRRPAAAGIVLASFLGLSLLPELFFSSDSGRTFLEDWFRVFLAGMNPLDPDAPATAQAAGAWSAWNYLNQSLPGTLYRLFTPVAPGEHRIDVALVALDPGTIKLVSHVVLAALLVLFLAVTRTRDEQGAAGRLRLAGEFGLFACGMVLFSPMSSKSHFCVLLLAQSFVAVHALATRDPLLRGLVAVVLAVTLLSMRGLIGKELGAAVLAAGPVTAAALLTALATARALTLRAPTLRAGTATTPST
jgi:hypothetical protein